jgi:hypothetical protein
MTIYKLTKGLLRRPTNALTANLVGRGIAALGSKNSGDYYAITKRRSP